MSQFALNFDQARAQRDAGMQLAADHAASEDPGWADKAYDALVSYARAHRAFTSEEFRSGSGVKSPTTPKALGPIFRRAARDGVIEKGGFAIAKERHLSPCVLWHSLVNGPRA